MIDAIKHNKDRRIIRCVAEALGKIGDERSLDLLVMSLGDEDPMTSSRAAYALGFLKDKRAVEPLLHALTEHRIPCPAAVSLGRIKDPNSVEPLIEALEHEDMSVRGCAAIALGMIKDPRACKPLIKTFSYDRDPMTQNRARRALEMIGCSFKEGAQEYGIEGSLCDMGQRMVDFMSSGMEKYPDRRTRLQSPEWRSFFSEFRTELDRLNSTDPEAGKKLYGVFFLVSDWADSVERLRKLKRSSDKNKDKMLWNTVAEGIRDKETRLKVICPEMQFPDYT